MKDVPKDGSNKRGKKFKCTCCEKLVMNHREITKKKDKGKVKRFHTQCGGVLITHEKNN